MKHYPHHISDFNNATRHLTRIERSLYRDLIELYYETEKQLPLDVSAVCRRIVANECSTDVERLLNEFFSETKAGWYHVRCDEEITKYQNNTSQRAMAGKASAAQKALKTHQALNGKPTDVETPFNEMSTGLHNQSTNEPINQEPIKDIMSGLPDLALVSSKPPNGRKADCIEILSFLNLKTGKAYRPVDAHLSLIAARLKDGASVADCMAVITNQATKWSGDEKMDGFLRPATLFNATKFANYVGDLSSKTKNWREDPLFAGAI